MMTATRISSIAPVSRAEARVLAATEYDRMIDQLRSLSPADWDAPTECPGWNVRAMAGHSVAMLSDFGSFRSVMRRMSSASKAAKRDGVAMVDAMTAQQIADVASLSTDELVTLATANAPRAVAWRTKASPIRRMPMKEEVGGKSETWKLAYLFDVILTRDPWMHRGDIARATGHDLVLTPDHDGRIVADVVAEWARRHGQPFTLRLTGPAGGSFVSNDGGADVIEIDAVEFCRTLSGRVAGSGLLSQEVPF